jgi:hypothetical protein
LLTGGLNFSRFSSIHLSRLTGGCTAGVTPLGDDDGLEEVTVAMKQIISFCACAQDRHLVDRAVVAAATSMLQQAAKPHIN